MNHSDDTKKLAIQSGSGRVWVDQFRITYFWNQTWFNSNASLFKKKLSLQKNILVYYRAFPDKKKELANNV